MRAVVTAYTINCHRQNDRDTICWIFNVNAKGKSAQTPFIQDLAKKEFQYEIINSLKNPTFVYSGELRIKSPKKTLLEYMQEAVDDPTRDFPGFTVTYFSQLGYFINAINGVSGNYTEDYTYWKLIDRNTGDGLNVGISTYTPKRDDYIIFKLVQDEDHP